MTSHCCTCRVQDQEQRLAEQYAQMLQQRLQEQKETFQSEVAGSISRLRGIESAVEGNATDTCFSYLLVQV